MSAITGLSVDADIISPARHALGNIADDPRFGLRALSPDASVGHRGALQLQSRKMVTRASWPDADEKAVLQYCWGGPLGSCDGGIPAEAGCGRARHSCRQVVADAWASCEAGDTKFAEFGQHRSRFGQGWPHVVGVGQMLAELGCDRTKLGQHRPILTDVGHSWP